MFYGRLFQTDDGYFLFRKDTDFLSIYGYRIGLIKGDIVLFIVLQRIQPEFGCPGEFFVGKVHRAVSDTAGKSARRRLERTCQTQGRQGVFHIFQLEPDQSRLNQARCADPRDICIRGYQAVIPLNILQYAHTQAANIVSAKIKKRFLNIAVKMQQHVGREKIGQIAVCNIVVQ